MSNADLLRHIRNQDFTWKLPASVLIIINFCCF